ncbi:sensor histidine kinase [Desulfuromonas acetoxidans]|uniref:histidine kinase n=1 Tax=Desulfuromonas acetoxidans (strain DSM 684 / 11070) TaxID=281689 RepID=Q1K1A9_DESA6|nr:ATP-binding protein [Desulfuromonas acetoxidans]EAT16099.1 periplasmic sensor signal transduction histidine kinase [Desulfuromonas acetoxidans DSM 684]MBF0645240.1 sensor histidine kinase [Desulfuromonas acetoxidans]NVD25546.1 sensor histidine kinase [Desulfuromonas acetoxidans]NVE17644.1 sensor histidine kinase [Desulfuromonas acetoxidans]
MVWKKTSFRVILLLILVVGISSLHYTTMTHHSHLHDVYRRLYYIPIVLGGVWFGVRGGLGTSVFISIAYLPHVLMQWGHLPWTAPERYLEIMMYNVIGALTGTLMAKEHAQRLRAEETAVQLQESYDQLRQQADLILEIEEQLRQADRLTTLGELSAGLAHEIRNPLGSIRGTAEILQGAFSTEDRYHEFTTILINEVDRLNQVLENYLRYARPDSMEKQQFSLAPILDDVVQLTAVKARKNRVAVDVDVDVANSVAGDASQYKQAFLNLILNALQAMGEGGCLSILATTDENRAVVRFCDTGPGLTEEQRQKIFKPFYTTRSKGTGLGLAITERIVHNHGGSIMVESLPKQGCCFELRLPLADLTPTQENDHV